MTRKKRYLFSYLLLALALVVLFAANLFWGSVALTPGAVLAALTGRGQDALSGGIITHSLRQAICCRPFLPTPSPGLLSWAFPAEPSWP